MNLPRIRLRLLMALCVLFAALQGSWAQAQDWPQKSIRYVVPFPPGAIADATGRLLAGKLAEKWGQQVFVDNKPGGISVIGANDVARSQPDGYTLLQALDFTWTMNPYMLSKLPYDPLRDFTHIAQIARVPLVIVANEKTTARTIPELIALARAQPGSISVGGTGPIVQVAVEKFSRDAGIKLMYVPYKGGADVVKGMLTGEIAIGFDGVASFASFFANGRLRPLATTGSQRATALPDVPALSEFGLMKSEFYAWHSLSGPAGMPRAVQQKIEADVRAILATADVRSKLQALGLEPIGAGSEEFIEAIKRESQNSATIIKELGLRLD